MAGQQALRLEVTENGVRVRQAPVNGKPIGQCNKGDIVDVLDDAAQTRMKVGKKGEWIKVRKQDSTEGYVSAGFLKLVEEATAASAPPTSAKPAETAAPAATPAAAPAPAAPTLTPAAKPAARVQPTTTLNLRQEANTTATVLTKLGGFDILDILDDAAAAQAKIGQKDQWIKVKTQAGQEGYVSAQYVQSFTGEIPQYVMGARNLTGMNLDRNHPQGKPAPDLMKGIGWIRVKFNISFNPDNGTYGNTDVDAAYNRTKSFIEPYVRAGMKVCMVFTHQLFGEGAGYYWPGMDTNRWNDFIPKFADYARRAAQKFVGSGLVHVYQVWNEQDTRPQDARAAVPIPAGDYANMLAQTIRAIRSVDKNTLIITGGHTRGPGEGGEYARKTIAALPGDARPDGIAAHPYGRGVRGHQFSNWGPLSDEINAYKDLLPGKPIWFTEWGVLDRQFNDAVATPAADYAAGFIGIVKSPEYANKIAAAMWYAWADGMDNGYGLVNASGQPREPLYSRFLKL